MRADRRRLRERGAAERLAHIDVGTGIRPVRDHVQRLCFDMETVLEPVFSKIDFDVDIDERKGRIKVDGYIDTTGEPIRNPVTGNPHRARIDLPHGFEYSVAEVGSASSTVRGPIELDLKNSYGQFARICT